MNANTYPAGAAQPVAAEFLSLEGRYTIDPANTRDQLLEDAHSLLICAVSVLDGLDESFKSTAAANAFWCAFYALKQARACIGEALAPTTTGVEL